jgi:4-hydroxybenzoate polyprenyltransferase
MPGLSTLLRLGRISNLPTVWTNVLAGSVIAGGAAHSKGIGLIAIAMTAFYVGGMYLNDFFDREIDARDRPGRPIDAGEIGANAVMLIGFGLLAAGVALMIAFGSGAIVCGLLLTGVIVLYDIWHKGHVLSPVVPRASLHRKRRRHCRRPVERDHHRGGGTRLPRRRHCLCGQGGKP